MRNWRRRYTCKRCDVSWDAGLDERIPDTCWMCEKNDMSTVWTQAGVPVTIPDTAHTGNQYLGSRQWGPDTRAGGPGA